ncbi:MAG TPA: hypothetical protein VH063_03890 [Gaiellaceae bacterium]|jgi:hypothetical protein|nr:hypothetical protein [Gaiellaceae bacterium]
MPEVAFAAPTRREAFEPLLDHAKHQVLELVAVQEVTPGEGWFLGRAVFDLESDGVELFGAERAADARFHDEVRAYLAARVGAAQAALITFENLTVLEFSGRGSALDRDQLDSALIQLGTPRRYA